MSHVTYKWVMSHMNESCHTCAGAESESHLWMSNILLSHTYEWVIYCIWMRHVTHMNESCHMYECVMSHIWRSHVTNMNESCHTYKWMINCVWISCMRVRFWSYRMLQYVTVCCSVIQCVAAFCSKDAAVSSLKKAASLLQNAATHWNTLQRTATQL